MDNILEMAFRMLKDKDYKGVFKFISWGFIAIVPSVSLIFILKREFFYKLEFSKLMLLAIILNIIFVMINYFIVVISTEYKYDKASYESKKELDEISKEIEELKCKIEEAEIKNNALKIASLEDNSFASKELEEQIKVLELEAEERKLRVEELNDTKEDAYKKIDEDVMNDVYSNIIFFIVGLWCLYGILYVINPDVDLEYIQFYSRIGFAVSIVGYVRRKRKEGVEVLKSIKKDVKDIRKFKRSLYIENIFILILSCVDLIITVFKKVVTLF